MNTWQKAGVFAINYGGVLSVLDKIKKLINELKDANIAMQKECARLSCCRGTTENPHDHYDTIAKMSDIISTNQEDIADLHILYNDIQKLMENTQKTDKDLEDLIRKTLDSENYENWLLSKGDTTTAEEVVKKENEAAKSNTAYPYYNDELAKLKAAHPNWEFIFYETNISFEDFVNSQYYDDVPKAIPGTKYASNQEEINLRVTDILQKKQMADTAANREYIEKEYLWDSGMVLSNKLGIEYYANPENYLNEGNIYAFLELGFNEQSQYKQDINNLLEGTMFANTDYYADVFYSCGEKYGINPYYLIIKSFVESGTHSTPSQLAKGYEIGGVSYYNFFGYGCYDGQNAMYNGALYAKENGWDSPEKAIAGGAEKTVNGYINNGQDTLYSQRFNYVDYPNQGVSHQYGTAINMAEINAGIFNKKLDDVLDDATLTFIIPIYE